MMVTKVVEGCVYIRRRYYGILLRLGGEFEHSALFVWIVSAMTVAKVVEGCVYIRRRYYGILLRVGGEFEHSALRSLSALSPISLSRSVL